MPVYISIDIPNQLLMALAAAESGLKWLNRQSEIVDITFDQCAYNARNEAIGLMQTCQKDVRGLESIKFLKLEKDYKLVHADLCGDPKKSAYYASIMMQEKCNNANVRNKDAAARLAFAAKNYGPPQQINYGPNAIEIMEALQKDYTKKRLLDILNIQKKRG